MYLLLPFSPLLSIRFAGKLLELGESRIRFTKNSIGKLFVRLNIEAASKEFDDGEEPFWKTFLLD